MAATKWNLDLNAGESWKAIINLLMPDGVTNRDLTGHTLESQIRRHAKSASVKTTLTLTVLDEPTGSLQIDLSPTQTSLMKFGKYVYDVELTETATGKVERVIEGVFTIRPEVTV
jgi:hypothetical protein